MTSITFPDPTGPDLHRDLLLDLFPEQKVFEGARKAASVLILRDAPELQVLLLRKAERGGDWRSGITVFPGGVLDAQDRNGHAHTQGLSDEAASQQLNLPQYGLDYFVAAARECFEEVGLLMGSAAGGPQADAWARAVARWRAPLQRGQASWAELCADVGWTLTLQDWAYWSHWLTPPGTSKRFDTRFFLTLAPEGQEPQVDQGEAVEWMWMRPQEALARGAELKLMPVTAWLLKELMRFESARSALAAAQALLPGQVPLTMPRLAKKVAGSSGISIVHPREHAWAEMALRDPSGTQAPSAQIQAGEAVALMPGVIRVTAPNPSLMTGPGTNSYLVGDPTLNRWTVIDPGPDGPGLEAHLDALMAAAPGPIERIVVTHTHRDHSPAARALAQRTGAPVGGQPAPAGAGQDGNFQPDMVLHDGDWLPLGEGSALGLRVLHTPGHASNHLCFELPHEGLLFTGDHLMQGSTVVINPPDGDMSAYLRSLGELLDRPLRWLAPGHGYLVARPHGVIRALIQHRLSREAKVLAALGPQAQTLGELVKLAYRDVGPELHGLAQRSLLAHLLKLQHEGRAEKVAGASESADGWRLHPLLAP